jgi:hypothetical protein
MSFITIEGGRGSASTKSVGVDGRPGKVEESSEPDSSGPSEPALFNIAEIVALTPPPNDSKVKPIKRLTVMHRRMIALYLQGHSYQEIGVALQRNPNTVGAVIRNPASQAIIEKAFAECDNNLKALTPLATEAIRESLRDEDNKVKLQAVDRLYRALGKYRDNPDADTTAEDVVRRIITHRHGDSEVVIAEERRK